MTWSECYATGYQLANISPVPAELDLAVHEVELIEPERVYAHGLPDDRAIVVQRDLDHTIPSLSGSRHDADICRHLFELFGRERANFVQGMFRAPPSLPRLLRRLLRRQVEWRESRFSLQSVRSWANETSETEVVRSLVGVFGLFVGAAPDDGGGLRKSPSSSAPCCNRPRII
jgi:beta-carotene ketolase (CrtO type)